MGAAVWGIISCHGDISDNIDSWLCGGQQLCVFISCGGDIYDKIDSWLCGGQQLCDIISCGGDIYDKIDSWLCGGQQLCDIISCGGDIYDKIDSWVCGRHNSRRVGAIRTMKSFCLLVVLALNCKVGIQYRPPPHSPLPLFTSKTQQDSETGWTSHHHPDLNLDQNSSTPRCPNHNCYIFSFEFLTFLKF